MELSRDFYVGIVEDNKDPNRKGRIKVRVQTLYHNIPVEDIPYAYPFAGLAGKEFQVPALGKLVNVLFLSDDLYSPYYIYSENYNENLQRKLKDLSDEEYVDFTAMLFDESTQIFVKGKEFTMDQLLNKITINNTSINLELKDNTQVLNLGSRVSNKPDAQDAVLGTRFFEWMDKFISEIASPFSFMGNMGAPVLKTKLEMLCQEYQLLRPNFLSNNVKIVDNGKVKKLKRTPEVINNKNDIDLVVPPEENPEYARRLNDAVREQNDKSCNNLKNAAPVGIVPLNEKAKDPEAINYIWSGRQTKNRIQELHPVMQPYAIEFVNRCKSVGIKLEITSGYRTISRQTELFEKDTADLKAGLIKKRKAARPGSSYHNFGLAIDVKTINSNDWETVGKIGESIGFRWGRYFVNPRSEDWHFDMGFGFSPADLKRKLDNGDVSGGFVNLGMNNTENLANNQELNGQNYLVNSDTALNSDSINIPCSGSDEFNRKYEDKLKTNENGAAGHLTPGSDENEDAPTKKLEEQAEEKAKAQSELTCKEKASKDLLNQIAEGEGTTDKKASREKGAENAYDVTYGYGKYTPETLPNGKPVQPISKLTIGEVKQVQQMMLDNQKKAGIPKERRSSAIGKYQLISGTLDDLLKKNKNISDDAVFSEELQDKLGIQKLDDRGYDKWLSGKISDEQFQKNISKEWASIADPDSGKSYYGQHVGTSDNTIKEMLSKTKNQMNDCA